MEDYLILERKLLIPEIDTIFTTCIFSFYFRALMPYINYCLNDKKTKKEFEKVNKINITMKKQLLKIFDKYIEYLNNVS